MSTVVEALQTATDELHAAAVLMQTLGVQVQQNLTNTTASTTTIVNNFINRPAVTVVFCDPVNGNDANDGATIAHPKKDLDAIISGMGSNPTQIMLLNNAILSKRTTVNVPLFILGIQASGADPGYITFRRRLSFLGTATNSPIPLQGSFCAGIFFQGPLLRLSFVDVDLVDVPSGLDYRNHLTSAGDLAVSSDAINLTASSAQAGQLFGTLNGRLTASIGGVTFGSGAAGHLFLGVAAGSNPNSLYNYTTNILSA